MRTRSTVLPLGTRRVTTMRQADKERSDAIAQLREWLKPGDTVYTILDSVSRSGMSRQIRVVVPYSRVRCRVCGHERTSENCTPTLYVGEVCERAPECTGLYEVSIDHLHPNYSVAKAIGARQAKKGDGIIMGGCGMDMGFALVYELSQVLYGGRLTADIYKDSATQDEPGPRGRLLTREGAPEGQVWIGGYRCLGKGKCPSNYHANHRDRVRCDGVGDRSCYAPGRWEVPADWPRRTIEVEGETVTAGYLACLSGSGEEGKPYEVCPTCQGIGDLPNPDGPERFDLVHTDGYALKHRWL